MKVIIVYSFSNYKKLQNTEQVLENILKYTFID